MHLIKLITLSSLLAIICTPYILFAEPEFECHGYRTIIYKNIDVALAVCHSPQMKIKRSLLAEWQDCPDAMIYIRNKKNNKLKLHTDCIPTTHKEFKINGNNLLIKHYHNEYPGFNLKPLLIEKYNILDKTKKYTLIAKLPNYSKSEIQRAITNLEEEVSKPFNGSTYFKTVYDCFYKLRAYAQTNHKFVLEKLKEFEDRGIFSGEVSGTLNEVTQEAEFISLATKNNE